MSMPLRVDEETGQDLIRQRKERGIDLYDEVWEGVYVMPSMPHLSHQELLNDLGFIVNLVVRLEKRGNVYPGANVSDRRTKWKENFRVPDRVALLTGNPHCVNRGSYLLGGPDFLVEIESPGDDTDLKISFYTNINVRELLVIHRDTRRLRLYRHNSRELAPVEPTELAGKKWLVSEVVPLAFRRKAAGTARRTEVRRTDGQEGSWTI